MRALERQLVPFAAVIGGSPLAVSATVRRRAGFLNCRLTVVGSGLLVPEPARDGPERRDALWQRTCAEVFLGCVGRPGYLEWNLSPAGHWNLYRFEACRTGGRDETAVADAAPRVTRSADALALEGELPLRPLGLEDLPLDVGVSAVLQLADGTLSYWALAHPAARPDFHDRRGFVLRLDPVVAAASAPEPPTGDDHA